jgi:LysM repeat protein
VTTPVAVTRTHTVQKGETLLKVAQRYGMTLAEIKQLNKLRAEHVNAGTRLTVAVAETGSKPNSAGQRNTLAEVENKHAEARSEAVASAATRSHTVRKGETLVQVASRYGMTLAELKQLNKLRADQVNAGTRLAVAAPEAGSKSTAAAPRSVLAENDGKHAEPRSRGRGQQHDAQRTQGRNAGPGRQPLRHDAGRVETAQQTACRPGQRRHQAAGGSAGKQQQAHDDRVAEHAG